MENKKLILYIIIGVLVLGLILLTIFPGIIQAIKDSGNSGPDKCTPEPGYTEQEWIEHMGHHPEIYKECLG